MRAATSKIDKIVIFCRNVEKSSSIYCETLGLKVVLQSIQFAELKDTNNLSLFLQRSKNAAHLCKGYSPMISVKVEHFDEVFEKMKKYDLICDGDPIEIEGGKIATFQGLDGETISINNIKELEEQAKVVSGEVKVEDEEILRILEKLKM